MYLQFVLTKIKLIPIETIYVFIRSLGLGENRFGWWIQFAFFMIVNQFEYAGADRCGHSQNNSFRYSVDGISLTIISCIEQMVGRFLKLYEKK